MDIKTLFKIAFFDTRLLGWMKVSPECTSTRSCVIYSFMYEVEMSQCCNKYHSMLEMKKSTFTALHSLPQVYSKYINTSCTISTDLCWNKLSLVQKLQSILFFHGSELYINNF